MAKKPINKDLLVGIDIGTSKVVTLVGEMSADGKLNVIGFGSHPSQGLKRGVVVNIESTVQSIQRSVEDAELMALAASITRSTSLRDTSLSRIATIP